MCSVFIPGEAPKKLFKCVGMNVSKAKIEEGKLKVTGRELTYYLDPVTGEKLTTWDNPWTGEKNLPVVHIANDPVQMVLPTAIPLDVRRSKFNSTATIVSEVRKKLPTPYSKRNLSNTCVERFLCFILTLLLLRITSLTNTMPTKCTKVS